MDDMKNNKNVIAIGIFDGVHKGHRRVIETAVETARETGAMCTVCTFDTASVTSKGSSYRPLISDEHKTALLIGAGADDVYSLDFGGVRDMTAEDFTDKILSGTLGAGCVVCGSDFRMGRGAACGTEQLGEILGQRGIQLLVADDVNMGDMRISSSRIREYIASGDISSANAFLGWEYSVQGTVVHGNEIGRTIGFPTANIPLDTSLVIPRYGVYTVYTDIGGSTYKGVANIGVKPTIEGERDPLCEVWLKDFSGVLYGTALEIRFTRFIRPEMRFDSLEELRGQIGRDKGALLQGE